MMVRKKFVFLKDVVQPFYFLGGYPETKKIQQQPQQPEEIHFYIKEDDFVLGRQAVHLFITEDYFIFPPQEVHFFIAEDNFVVSRQAVHLFITEDDFSAQQTTIQYSHYYFDCDTAGGNWQVTFIENHYFFDCDTAGGNWT